MRVRMWAFRDPLFFVFTLLYILRVRWVTNLRSSGSLSLPSLRSWLMWLHFMFDLHELSLFFVFFASPSSSLLLLIHSLRLVPVLFLQWPIPSLILSLHHPYASHYQFILFHCFIIIIMFALITFRSLAHEIFYTCCILYMRAWVLIIGYLDLVSLHFYHPITLAYVTSWVLRPPWGHDITHYVW